MKLAELTSEYRGNLIIEVYSNWVNSGDAVLDIGCGNGVISTQLKEEFNIKLVGCDVLDYLIRDIKFVKITNESKLPFKRLQFKTAMFNDVLHHMPFGVQEKLLLEAVRVGKNVLIFELQPTFIGKGLDFILNKMHDSRMKIPFTYRSPDEWISLFIRMGLKYEAVFVRRPVLYPFKHVAFRLSAK